MQPTKMAAGAPFPKVSWPTVGGGALDPASGEGWRLLVVYRGKHCPLCKTYLKTLNDLLGDFTAAKISVAALSADSRDKAVSEAESQGWSFTVGYDLTPPQMMSLGLYVSTPRSAEEADRPFAEPGLFVINPNGLVQIIDISNAPFVRPDLRSLLGGLQFVIAKDYPIRGMA